MIQNREEFVEWIERNFNGVSVDGNSPLWIPEQDLQSTQCGWFATVRPLQISARNIKSKYWNWCHNNLHGYVRCFWSNDEDEKECWGFTQYEDIALWLLKWSH